VSAADAPRRILFVCTGNICRSAMAEHWLRHRGGTLGLELEVRSCGVAAESWYEVPEAARRALARRGVPPFEHKAQLVSRDLLRWADLVLTMTRSHRDSLADRFPEFRAKLRLLREEAGFGAQDVADPMGRPDETFERCLAAIEESLEALLAAGFKTPAR
jgi:protein-tyrosine phosphatase